MDIEQPGSVGPLLNELVEKILPANTDWAILTKYKSYTSRILSSRIGASSYELEDTIVARMHDQAQDISTSNIKNDNWGQKRVVRLQECLNRLTKLKSLKNRPSVLKVLSSLSVNKSSFSVKQPLFGKVSPKTNGDGFSGREITAMKPLEALNSNQEMGKEDVMRSEVIRDLFYVFNGIDGAKIRYSSSKEAYEVDSKIDLLRSEKDMLIKLSEMGSLYKKIKEFLDYQKTQIKGLICQAMSLAIDEELNNYHRLLVGLENIRDSSNQFGGLTLKSLFLYTIEPIECLKWILILCDVCKPLKGGQILSALFSYDVHGYPDVQKMVNNVLTKSLAPFMNFLKIWVYNGEHFDPMGEFFILINKKELGSEEIWADKYKMNTEMIPSFMTVNTAQKILNTGKSGSFLKRICKVNSWALSAEFITVENLISFKFMEGLKFRAFENWVQSVHSESNTRLKEVIIDRFDFFGHCRMIKSFILQGKGDFINLLLDSMQEHLDVSASSVFKNSLVSILESTKTQISLNSYKREYIERIGVVLSEHSPGEKGWDIFSLKYEIDSPLNTIFDPSIMRFYYALFNHLWRIRNLIFLLNNSSKVYSRIFIQNKLPRKVIQKLEQLNIIRHQMLHFLTTLLSYLMLEVIETEWNTFLTSVEKNAESLDDIINRHRDFIVIISDKTMLNNKTNPLFKQLKDLLKCVELFTRTSNSFIANIESNVVPQRSGAMDEEISEDFEEGRDSPRAREETERGGFINMDNLVATFKMIKNVWRSFWKNFDEFLQHLERDQKMKSLSFRLDFNEYYKMKRHLEGTSLRLISGADRPQPKPPSGEAP